MASVLFRPHSDAASSLGLHSTGKTSATWSVVRDVLGEVGAGGAALRGEAPGGVVSLGHGDFSEPRGATLSAGRGERESQALCGEIHREMREIHTGEMKKFILHEGT